MPTKTATRLRTIVPARNVAQSATNRRGKPQPPALVEPTKESRRDRFERIGKARMRRALNSIRLIANLANKANYEYSAEDIDQMRATLLGMVEATMTRFEKKPVVSEFQFRSLPPLPEPWKTKQG